MYKKTPLIILLFFLVLISLDSLFIYIAKSTYSGVYTENHYQKGVDFEKLNKLPIYDKNTGWKGTIKYSDLNKTITVTLVDKDKKNVELQSIEAKALRPVTDKYDFQIKLKKNGKEYSAPVNFPLKGQWEIRVKAITKAHTFIFSETIHVEYNIRTKNL